MRVIHQFDAFPVWSLGEAELPDSPPDLLAVLLLHDVITPAAEMMVTFDYHCVSVEILLKGRCCIQPAVFMKCLLMLAVIRWVDATGVRNLKPVDINNSSNSF